MKTLICSLVLTLTISCKDDELQCISGSPCAITENGIEVDERLTNLCGECLAGTFDCKSGRCDGFRGPSDEVCDGKDNNCNCETDDNVPSKPPGAEGNLCVVGACGICQDATAVCDPNGSGEWLCNAASPEVCDGKDNNCNCETDENIPVEFSYSGPPDTVGVGACRPRVVSCVDGAMREIDEVLPIVEIDCTNGIDDDCDGQTDELLITVTPRSVLLVMDYSGSMGGQRWMVIDGICNAAAMSPLSFYVAVVALAVGGNNPYSTLVQDFVPAQQGCDYLRFADTGLGGASGATEPQPEAIIVGLDETEWPTDDRVVLLATDEPLQEYNGVSIGDVETACLAENFELVYVGPQFLWWEWTPIINVCGGTTVGVGIADVAAATQGLVVPQCAP